jgi:HSP90 family molecular chaperone
MGGKRILEINPRHPIIKELREKVALDSEVHLLTMMYKPILTLVGT